MMSCPFFVLASMIFAFVMLSLSKHSLIGKVALLGLREDNTDSYQVCNDSKRAYILEQIIADITYTIFATFYTAIKKIIQS